MMTDRDRRQVREAPRAQPVSARSAVISSCETYRYHLRREFAPTLAAPTRNRATLLYVMVNPSIADGETDDATIRICNVFAQYVAPSCDCGVCHWSAFEVVNLFAFRATDIQALARAHKSLGAEYVIGPENDRWIRNAARKADRIIVAWGAKPGVLGHLVRQRAERVLSIVREVHDAPLLCLGVAKDGSPLHPLMTRYQKPVEWNGWTA